MHPDAAITMHNAFTYYCIRSIVMQSMSWQPPCARGTFSLLLRRTWRDFLIHLDDEHLRTTNKQTPLVGLALPGTAAATTTMPIEARDYSQSITQLAANPPAYPRNVAHKPLDSLSLYIVRVPGSRGAI